MGGVVGEHAEHGALVDLPNVMGVTPLMAAAMAKLRYQRERSRIAKSEFSFIVNCMRVSTWLCPQR